MVIFESQWTGKTVGVNKWHGATVIKGRARIYENKEAKDFKQSLAWQWSQQKQKDFSGYVDMAISLSLWKRKDSDSCVKFIMDSFEEAGILDNDNKIRNIFIYRHYHKRDELDSIKVRLTSVDS